MSDILSLKFKFLFPRKSLFDQMVATMSMGEQLQTFNLFYFLLFYAFFLTLLPLTLLLFCTFIFLHFYFSTYTFTFTFSHIYFNTFTLELLLSTHPNSGERLYTGRGTGGVMTHSILRRRQVKDQIFLGLFHMLRIREGPKSTSYNHVLQLLKK